jgi:hypothetical protein
MKMTDKIKLHDTPASINNARCSGHPEDMEKYLHTDINPPEI